jgi:mannose-1-phosphate guanylyltransferase
MVIAPSDHLVLKEDAFSSTIRQALDFVSTHDALVTLGIRPTRPDTGYGYIQYLEDWAVDGVYKVKTFTEKPTEKIAQDFIESGDFLWNSGIFVWSMHSILEAFEKHLPEVHEAFADSQRYLNGRKENSFVNTAFSTCSNISIDYGVMEKADNVYVIPASFGWSDLGTWASLYDHHERDYLGNAVSGKNVFIYDASGCVVVSPDDKLAVLHGLKDYIVVDTQDVLLICHMSKEQEIKQILTDIRRVKGETFL